MASSSSAGRSPLAPHRVESVCPWCEQPITHQKFEDIRRRMTQAEQQRFAILKEEFARKTAAAEASTTAAIGEARAEAAALAEQRVLAVRAQAKATAEAALADTFAELQARLAAAEQETAAAQERMAGLSATHETAIRERMAAMQQAHQADKQAAVLAEKARTFEESQRLQLKLAELQRQLEGKTAHELGEASELDLFELLRNAFEGDRIRRVGKGVNGADVVHEVVHNGKVCGKIIYDSKNRNAWQNEFASKLRADKLAERADHAVLSSNKFPKGTQQLHNQDGVIIANPGRILALAEILRRNVVQTYELRIGNDERERKTVALYDFITSERCKQLLDAIDAQTGKLLELDTAEEKAHRLTWERRSKLIRVVKKAQADLTFEMERIIGTAGNGPEDSGSEEVA